MPLDEWLGALAALVDLDAQRAYLDQHVDLLDDAVAAALKAEADRGLRADLDQSRRMVELLAHLAELTGDPCHRALGLLADANVRLIGLGICEEAVALYDRAATLYRGCGREVEAARSQIGKISALARLGRHDEAIACGRWAAPILQEHAVWRPLADLNLNLGYLHTRLGDDATALLCFDQARRLYAQVGAEGEPYLPWVDQNRAVALMGLGQFEASIEASHAAHEGLTRSGQEAEAARARQTLALAHLGLGRYNEALDHLDQARQVFAEDGRSRDAILASLLICDCLLQLRRFPSVLERCAEIRQAFADLGTYSEVAQALVDEAVAYAGLGRLDEAIASLDDARALYAQEGNRVNEAVTDLEMAVVRLRQQAYEASRKTARNCAGVFDEYGKRVRRAQAELVAARAAVALDRHKEARGLLASVLAVSQAEDIPQQTYQAHHLLGRLALAEQDPSTASSEYALSIRELERLRGRVMVEHHADFIEDKQAPYEDMVALCVATEVPDRALEYAERAKSRSLLEMLANRVSLDVRPRAKGDQELVDELMRLRAARDGLYRRWEARRDLLEKGWEADEKSRRHAQHQILDLEARTTDLWHRLLVRNADYARDASLWQVRAEPVAPYLPQDTTLIEYYVIAGEYLAFVVGHEGVTVHPLHIQCEQIERLIHMLRLNIRAVPGSPPAHIDALHDSARGLLGRLYQGLLAPLDEMLPSRDHLLFVPHGPLHYMPFHALYDGEAYLVQRHQTSTLPAASMLRFRSAGSAEASGALVMGHSHGGRLPHAVREAHAVANVLGVDPLTEERATTEALRQVAPGSRLVHLATHAAFRPDNPLFSGISMADGWLTALDVFGMRLGASLVTLSACQTGASVVGGGDELLGIMRAFLCAGAASLLLSQWTVDDQSTAWFMEAFYRAWMAGHSSAAALRQVQMAFVEGRIQDQGGNPLGSRPRDPRTMHPYYWAPFFLVGDGGAPSPMV